MDSDPQGPHHFGILDPHLDPLPHQITIRIGIRILIRIKIYKLNPNLDPHLHQLADVKPKCIEYEPVFIIFSSVRAFF